MYVNSDIQLVKKIRKIQRSFTRAVLDWSKENLDCYPWRTETTPFRILLAEILLTRTTASAVNRVFNDFVGKYDSFQKILTLGANELREDLSSIGHQNQRAMKLVEISSIIMSDFNGEIPSSFDDLVSIKHIGPYIAGAVLSLGFSKRATMVDSNIVRLMSRFFVSSCDLPMKTKDVIHIVDLFTPESDIGRFNLALLDISRNICSYRTAKCDICPISVYCEYPKAIH